MLLLDLDPQANATSGLGLEKLEGASSYRVLLGEGGLLDKMKGTQFEHLEIVPSEVDLCAADLELARLENHLLRLANILKPVVDDGRFEIVLIDCPPSLGVLTLNAFAAASDGLLVPLQCEYYALEGISMMNRVLAQLRETGVNPRLDIFGVLMTMYDGRTKLAQRSRQRSAQSAGARGSSKRSSRAPRGWRRRPVSASRSFIMTSTAPVRRPMSCWRRKVLKRLEISQ